MQQFCYTSCLAGRSVTGADGWQVRAVSPGVSEGQASSFERFFRYSRLPVEPGDRHIPPEKLAFITEPRRLLIHTVPTGLDPTTRRTGNYFAHVFVDPPDGFDALDAVATWKSEDWIVTDFPGSVSMPQPTAMPRVLPAADESAMFLKDAVRRQWAAICLQAVLSSDDSRLYLAGDPDVLVRLIYIVALCLPRSRRQGLSFSTYEGDPSSLKVRITGTSFPDSAKADLPDYCYTNGRFGLNTYTNRQSVLAAGRYAERAIAILANEGGKALSAFVQTMEEAKARGAGDLDVLAGALPTPDSDQSLATALAWPLTAVTKEKVILAAVSTQRPLSQSVFEYLLRNHSSLMHLLPALLSSCDHDRTIRLLKSSHFGFAWAERVLDRVDDIPEKAMRRVAHEIVQSCTDADFAVFCEHNVGRLSLRPEADPILSAYIASLSSDRAATRHALSCCRCILGHRHRLPGVTVSRCRAFLDIGRFLRRPALTTARLDSLGRGLRHVSLGGVLGHRLVATLSGLVALPNWPAFASFVRSQPQGWFSSLLLDRLCRRLLVAPRHSDADLLPAAIALQVEMTQGRHPHEIRSIARDAVAMDPALCSQVFHRLAVETPVHAFRFISSFLSPPQRLEMLVLVAQGKSLPRTEILKCLVRSARVDVDTGCYWRILHDHLPSLLSLLRTPVEPFTSPLWEAYVAQYPLDRCNDFAGVKNLRLLSHGHAPMRGNMTERLDALCSVGGFLLSPAADASALTSIGQAFAALPERGSAILVGQTARAILSVTTAADDVRRAIAGLGLAVPDFSAAVLASMISIVVQDHCVGHLKSLRLGLVPLILGANDRDVETVIETIPRRERIRFAQSIWVTLNRKERCALVAASADYANDPKGLWNEAFGRKVRTRFWNFMGSRRVASEAKENTAVGPAVGSPVKE